MSRKEKGLIPIKDAIDLYPKGSIGRRIAEWLGYLVQCNAKYIKGPIEDVPVEFDRFWFVGCEHGLVFYRIGAIVNPDVSVDERGMELSLLSEVDNLASVSVNEAKIVANLAAHQVTRQTACLGLMMGKRVVDGQEVALLCFSPAFTFEEAVSLLKETADIARPKLEN